MGAFRRTFLLIGTAALLGAGCQTTSNPHQTTQAGPDGTVAYYVPVDASEPGTRIEVNGESMGLTPLTLRIYGDRDGTFHNFGSYEFIVKAFPPGEGRYGVTKVFKTGALFAQEDKIPDKIYFDFSSQPKARP